MLGPVKISDIRSLEPLPATLMRLTQMVSDPSVTIDDFGTVVKYDQALTANVLRWANSAWSQACTAISDIRQAIVRLGTESIVKLAIGRHIRRSMSRRTAGYDLEENALWRHSVAAALAVEHVARWATSPVPREGFTAALLHDLGKLVLNRYLMEGDLKERVCEHIRRLGCSYIEAERLLLGTDHAEVGGAVAEEWKLPGVLVVAISHHHEVSDEPDVLRDAVQLSNAVAKLVGEGLGTEQFNLEVSSAAAARLGLEADQVQALCAVVHVEFNQAEALWRIT